MLDLVYFSVGSKGFSFVDTYNITIQLKNEKLFFSKTWEAENRTFSIDPFTPEPYHTYMFYGTNNLSLYNFESHSYNELPLLMKNLLLPFRSNMLVAFGSSIKDALICLTPLIKKSQIYLSLDPDMKVNWIELDPYTNIDIIQDLANRRFNGFNLSVENLNLIHNQSNSLNLLKSKEDGYYDLNIQKVDYQTSEPLNDFSDLDLIKVGSTAGMLNASQISLSKGKGTVRFYPMGYKGLMEFYVGRPYNYPLSKYTIELY